jgi:hypothetical protein
MSHCDFYFHFSGKVEHFLIDLLAICMSSFEKCIFIFNLVIWFCYWVAGLPHIFCILTRYMVCKYFLPFCRFKKILQVYKDYMNLRISNINNSYSWVVKISGRYHLLFIFLLCLSNFIKTVSFGISGIWTRGFMIARQVLYQLSHAPAVPFLALLFLG